LFDGERHIWPDRGILIFCQANNVGEPIQA
jgi:hypothetical protein